MRIGAETCKKTCTQCVRVPAELPFFACHRWWLGYTFLPATRRFLLCPDKKSWSIFVFPPQIQSFLSSPSLQDAVANTTCSQGDGGTFLAHLQVRRRVVQRTLCLFFSYYNTTVGLFSLYFPIKRKTFFFLDGKVNITKVQSSLFLLFCFRSFVHGGRRRRRKLLKRISILPPHFKTLGMWKEGRKEGREGEAFQQYIGI